MLCMMDTHTSMCVDQPDDGVLLPLGDVCVVGEEDGVVGHHGVARGQDAPHDAHAIQDAVIHQQVIYKQLHTTHAQQTDINSAHQTSAFNSILSTYYVSENNNFLIW